MTDGEGQSSGTALSPNSGHLAATDPLLAQHGAKAERFVFEEPITALFKLPQFGEALAQQAAGFTGMYASPQEPQIDLLRRLRDAWVTDYEVSDLFHSLREAGNRAVHDNVGTQRDALHQLRIAWKLGVWFQRAFKNRRRPHMVPGTFQRPHMVPGTFQRWDTSARGSRRTATTSSAPSS